MDNLKSSCCCDSSVVDERLAVVKSLIESQKSIKGSLIPVLHGIQNVYGYLPEDILHIVSEELQLPMTEIYGVATFYHLFSLEPKGKHIIRVCMGTACYVKGSQTILERLSQELKIAVGKTSDDGMFTLEATRCLGACGLSPVITVDEKVYAKVTLEDARRILDEYKKNPAVQSANVEALVEVSYENF